MTAPTPEQMRELADSADESLSYVGDGDWFPQDTMLQRTAAALRAAADQLEALGAERADLLAKNELALNQRDALAEVLGMEPEWTEYDA